MIEAIKQIDGYADMTAAEIVDALAVTSLRPESRHTFNSVVLELDGDVMAAEVLVAAMRAAGLNASADSFTVAGIDFGIAPTQGMIDQLASEQDDAFTGAMATKLKALGQQTEYQRLGGIGDTPTTEQVQAAIDDDAAEQEAIIEAERIAEAKRVANEAIDSRANELRAAVDAWDGNGDAPNWIDE